MNSNSLYFEKNTTDHSYAGEKLQAAPLAEEVELSDAQLSEVSGGCGGGGGYGGGHDGGDGCCCCPPPVGFNNFGVFSIFTSFNRFGVFGF
ncbi:MAG TPA: hypothetical protein VFN35_33230 [Ktedonobacteraceae bacterium]|nr:hypothetical protein [Ktedonobacteraceae bacterium]